MPQPVLVREVESPRSRSSGAAAVLLASMALFLAIGATSMLVRVGTTSCYSRVFEAPARPTTIAPSAARRPGFVSLCRAHDETCQLLLNRWQVQTQPADR